MKGLKLAGFSENKDGKSLVKVDGIEFGKDFVFIAGPCSIESEKQTIEIAKAVKKAGANILRGGALNQGLLLMPFRVWV